MFALRITDAHGSVYLILCGNVLDMDYLTWIGKVEPSGDLCGHFIRGSDYHDLAKALSLKCVENFLMMHRILEQCTLYRSEEVGLLFGAFSCKNLVVLDQ